MDLLKKLKNKKCLIIHHWDTDGICSAVMLTRFINDMKGEVDYFVPQIGNYFLVQEDLDQIKKKKADTLFIADYNLQIEDFSKLQKLFNENIIVFDHHARKPYPIENDYNPVARGEDGKKYPSAAFLINEELELGDEFLAFLGAVGDEGYKLKKNKYVKDELDKFLKRNSYKFRDIYKAVELIDSSYIVNDREEVTNIVKALTQDEDLQEILQNEKLLENVKRIEKEVLREIEKKPIKEEGKVLVYEIASDYRIISTVTRRLSERNPEKLIVVIEDLGDLYNVYLRRRDLNFDVSEIIEYAKSKGWNAGGKVDTGGVFVPRGEEEGFLGEVIERIVQ